MLRSYEKYSQNMKQELPKMDKRYLMIDSNDVGTDTSDGLKIYTSTLNKLIEWYLKFNQFNLKMKENGGNNAIVEAKKLERKFHFLLRGLLQNRVFHEWVYTLLSDKNDYKPKKFNVNYIDSAYGNMTYLMYAIKGKCDVKLLRLLCHDYKADPRLKNSMQKTAKDICEREFSATPIYRRQVIACLDEATRSVK